MAKLEPSRNTSGHSKASSDESPPDTEIPSIVSKNEIFSFLKTLFWIVFLAFVVIRGTIIEPFKIPSSSMVPTLQIGDYIFVWKFSYGLRAQFITKTLFSWSIPHRDDIVVFVRPDDPATGDDESATNIIKRVIGLPGDTVEVKGTKVYVNNNLLTEPFARWEDGGSDEGNFGPVTVPEGRVFLMGDNRDRSKDSRYWNDPFLPISNIKGRAFVIWWSWNSPRRIGTILR